MKKRIISILIILTILSATIFSLTTNIAFAQNAQNTQNETATVNEPNNKTYSLEDLLKDKKEQEEIKRALEEAPKPTEENKTEEKATLTAKDVTYTKPSYSADYIYGTDMPGYDYYLEESTVGNSQTNTTTSYFKIYKHDVINNTNKLLYDATSDNAHYITEHVRDNIIYVLYLTDYSMYNDWGTEYPTCWVVGIDLKTEKVVMKQSFECPQDDGYFPSFAVDGEQRVYIPYRDTGLKIFDKTGKLLYAHSPIEDEDGKYFNFIKGVSPNNKALLFEVMYRSWEPYAYAQTVYEGMQKLDNGVFVYKDEYTVFGRTYPSSYSLNPRWYFLDDEGTYAVDQYGRIAKFNYDVPDTTMGLSREIVLNLASSADDYGYYVGPSTPYYPNVCQNGNMIYILGAGGNIYFVNKSTLEYSQYISTEIETYSQIKSISYYEQSIFMLTGSTMKQFKLDNSNVVTIKDIIISESNTTSRTIPEIVAKYKQTSPTYNYNNSIYKTTPNWKNPYRAGSLQDGVVTDTINRLNYYRWLVGVKEIGVNYDKLDRNQKGAVISKANGTISHYPEQPSDMDDAFYEEAYDGCNAKYEEGDTYSGNVSMGDRIPYQAIEGFVSDLYNITIGSATGHRQSMLDPKATAISFGQCEEYSTASVYYDDSKDITGSPFYAFPSAGYFPNNEMAVSEYWSIYLTGTVSGTARVNFTYKGKTYSGVGLLFENGYPALSFRMPDELQALLGSEYDNIPGGTEIQVEVIGLKDENLNNVTYRYTVNFFDMKAEMPSAQDVADLIFDYKFYADKYPDLKAAFGYNEGALKNHWLTDGIREGRQCSAVFDVKYYVYNNEDVMKAFGTNYEKAYNHFITLGYAELRPSSNEYSERYYRNTYKDLKDFSAYNLMKHYMEYGRKEGRKATDVIDKTPIDIKPYLIDYNIYTTLEDNKDLKTAFGNNEGALKNHWETDGIREGRIASLVFDAKYYLERYTDLKKAYGNDYTKAYEHFVKYGINEGRQGSLYFNAKWYIENNKDLKEAYGTNYSRALEHFVKYGIKEGRIGSAEFNVKLYRENYEDLRKAYGTDYKEYYKHYIDYGKAEGRNGLTEVVRKLSELEEYFYNEKVYTSANKDIRELYKNDSTKTKNHWIKYGIRDGRKASLVFDAKYYLDRYPDLKEAYGNDYTKAYEHFIKYGIKEGRQGSMYFSAKYYLERYPDLKEAFGTDYIKALKHFVDNGIRESRVGSAEFNVKNYRANYKDLNEAFGDNYLDYYIHYMNNGIKEDRRPV